MSLSRGFFYMPTEYTIVFALLRVKGLGEEYGLDVCSLGTGTMS